MLPSLHALSLVNQEMQIANVEDTIAIVELVCDEKKIYTKRWGRIENHTISVKEITNQGDQLGCRVSKQQQQQWK